MVSEAAHLVTPKPPLPLGQGCRTQGYMPEATGHEYGAFQAKPLNSGLNALAGPVCLVVFQCPTLGSASLSF